ncbi:unnamed protein product, partial [Pleuronectes platessa]
MDKHFKIVFLFQEESFCDFISEFSKRQDRMLEFLNDLEEGAIQLDRMNKGAKISSVCLSVSEWNTILTVPLFRDLKWLQPQPVHHRLIFLHQQLPIHQTPRTEQQTKEADLL